MDQDLKWLVGIAVTICLAVFGAIVTSFRTLAARISSGNSELHKRVDDVKEKYVRRDDLDGHISRMDASLKELRDEVRTNHNQVIALLSGDRK